MLAFQRKDKSSSFQSLVPGREVFFAAFTLLSVCSLVRVYYTAETGVKYVALCGECTVVTDTLCVYIDFVSTLSL